jgi:acyl-CoA synthetase (AMP-forming)/AMP-acid ligase II
MNLPKLKLFWQYIDYWAEIDPEFPSIHYKKKIISALELKEQTDQFAKVLLSLGVKKGDTVVTVLSTIPEFVITYLGACKIGAITIPMDKEYKKADFKLLIPHSNPKVIVTLDKWQKNRIANNLEGLKEEFGPLKYIIVGKHQLGINFQEIMSTEFQLEKELEAAKENQDLEDCVLVVWTGGTTGAPKAVELTHTNIIEMCYLEYEYLMENFKELGVVDKDQRIYHLVNMPTSHVGGTIEMLGSGIVGGLKMIMHASWSPWEALKAMQQYNLSFMGGVPTMFKIFLSLPDLSKYIPKKYLKLIFMSGEKCTIDLLKDIKEKMCDNITVGYGSTEAGAEVTFTNPSDPIEKLASGYVGKPLPGMKIKIVDEEGNEVGIGNQGEILIKGPLTSKSYFRMPEEDKEGFTKDGLCKTGDLGYLDEHGGLYVSGRIKEIIRVGAFTVLPSEIEDLARQHPKVAIAAALGAPDKIHGEVVWLVIGPELGMKFEESEKEELQRMFEKDLAKFKVPKKIIIYPLDPNDLPITRIGKVDKLRLKKELIPKE